jgi:hypothetical protein
VPGEPAEEDLAAETTLEPKNLRISASLSRWARETERREARGFADVVDVDSVGVDEICFLRSGYLRVWSD